MLPVSDVPPAETASVAEADADDGRSWAVLPGAFYSQETSVGLAVFGNATLPLGDWRDTWPSKVDAAVVYTFNRQASVAIWPELYLGADNRWILGGAYVASHFPTRYYGIGPRTDAVWQMYTRRQVLAETSAMRHVAGPLYLGLADALSLTEIRDPGAPTDASGGVVPWTGGDSLGEGAVPGEAGGVVHGIGVRARVEGRDNVQSTRRGALVDVRATGHARWIGSDWSFSEAVVDVRGFHTFAGDWTLAGQWLTELRVGAVPFTHLAELGGDDVLRGMFEGRFRDHDLVALQGELRFPIAWRFRGAGFASAGQVFRDVRDLGLPPRWTAGGGLRLEIDREAHSTVRFDVGGGPDGAGLIFTFGEAF